MLYYFIFKGVICLDIIDQYDKERIIQEYVPGRQITLAHIISNPEPDLCTKLGVVMEEKNSIAILTITPSEAAIIAADIATKSAEVQIVFIDRFSGALVLLGDTASCEAATKAVIAYIGDEMGFSKPPITRS